MKAISLLYKNANEKPPVSESLSEVIYNLNIDRSVHYACKDSQCAEYFLSVISSPQSDTGVISYRSGILKDFLKYPKLLSELMQAFRSYDNLQNETEEMTNEIFRYGMPSSDSGLLDCTYEQLYINAHFARNVIAYFSEFQGIFEKYEVSSDGLCEMKSLCLSVKESNCIDEIERIAERFKNESVEGYSFTVSCELDSAMAVCKSTLADISDATKNKKSLLSAFKRKERIPSSVDIGNSASDNVTKALISALSSLSELFSDIAGGIYSAFLGIGSELRFYFAALDIARLIKKNGMNLCFPDISEKESDCLNVSEIYDLLLLTEGKNSESIVTNSFEMTQNGILATGDNNCGKTSFLRAVGTAVIFAQNGLFACADKMKASIRLGIFTHFSSAEKDFSDKNEAGRFEGEVIDIAKIMDRLNPYSLVLLNETFQTTAYREGAEGMKDILDIMGKINVKYIFVTHIKALLSEFMPENATALKVEGYKLTKA